MRRAFVTGAGREIGFGLAHPYRGAGWQAIATCAGAAIGG
jgi:NAD(P)-dependent dehydrogenase (short-subunit alcohol dehydrogenase family)